MLKNAHTLLGQIQKAERNWTAAEKGTAHNEYTLIKGYNQELDIIIQGLRNGDSIEDFKKKFGRIKTGFGEASNAIRAAGEDTKTFKEQLGGLAQKFSSWLGVSRVIMSVYKTMKNMVSTTIELQDAFTQLKIVTGATDAQMERFANTTFSLAKSLGKSATEVAKSIETFSRLGYSLEDASKLAEYATILSNVAGVDTNEATTGMTSIIKGYNMDVANTEHVADVLIEVGQKYAVSAGEMMDAYEHAGAALSATNTSFEKSAGLIAAANASVQNSSTVGTALKTLSARIRGSKSDLAELGENVDDLTNGFSKYADEIKQLTGFNIMIDGTTDQFKDLYDIFDGIAKTWDRLSDTSQARIAEILGGTRQYQVIASIIGNWSDAANAYADAMNAAGVATQANNTYMDTATAQIGVLKSSFQELSAEAVSSEFITNIIKFGNSLVNLLTKIIERFGTITTLLSGYGIVRGIRSVS